MKKYSYKIKRMREADMKIVRFKEEMDVLISSEDFIEKFRVYIEDMALFKKVNGRKFMRPTQYAALGILDQNDLIQEAYLAFLEAYRLVDWEGLNDNNPGGELWSYLKKSTALNLERQLRFKKDGIRIPEREHFKTRSKNVNMISKLFSQIDKIFFTNQEDVALTAWETDLVGAFLEVHMDDYLDLTRGGNRNLRGIEREVIKRLFGLDGVRLTYQELSDRYKVTPSTLRKVKERALKKLQEEDSSRIIADFLHEYRIKTQADTEKFKK